MFFKCIYSKGSCIPGACAVFSLPLAPFCKCCDLFDPWRLRRFVNVALFDPWRLRLCFDHICDVWTLAPYCQCISDIFALGSSGWEVHLQHGVRRGFKMILSHRALPSFNMSSYRAIGTHFEPKFIFWNPKYQILVSKYCSSSPKTVDPGPKILILAPKS